MARQGRARRWLQRGGAGVLLCALMMPPIEGGAATPGTSGDEGPWWHSGYVVDYGLIAVGGAAFGLTHLMDRPLSARLGPVYDPANPAEILDPRHADRIGRTYAEEGEGETVPTAWMGIALGGGLVGMLALEGVPWLRGQHKSARRLHDTVVGYVEGLALTLGVMEVLKMTMGRLRPDFQDRARRYHCHTEVVSGIDCTGTSPLDSDPDRARWLLDDGRKSFPSGHSASAMYLASYVGLAVGGAWVWGEDATFSSRSAGLLVQATLLTAGVFTAASRFDDRRHHIGDVLTGSAMGTGFALFSYFRRFDGSGRLRPRGPQAVSLDLTPGPGGRGLGLAGRF